MPIDNPLFAELLTRRLMHDQQRRDVDAPVRVELRELQRSTHALKRLRRAIRRTS